MSMEAFISGRSVISSTGDFAVPNPADQRSHESRLARVAAPASSSASSSAHGSASSSLPPGDGSDGGSGEGDGGNDIVLAKRTSQLMSSYRSYISKQDDEEALMGRIYSEGGSGGNTGHASSPGNGGGGLRERSVERSRERSPDHHGDAPLLREWNSGNVTSRCEMEVEDLFWDGNDDDDGGAAKDYRYTHPIYHSRKFKKFLLAVVLAVAVIGMIMISLHGGGEKTLPDWDAELKQALHEERGEGGGNGLLHHNVGIQSDAGAAPIDVEGYKRDEHVVSAEGEKEYATEQGEQELLHHTIGIDASRGPDGMTAEAPDVAEEPELPHYTVDIDAPRGPEGMTVETPDVATEGDGSQVATEGGSDDGDAPAAAKEDAPEAMIQEVLAMSKGEDETGDENHDEAEGKPDEDAAQESKGESSEGESSGGDDNESLAAAAPPAEEPLGGDDNEPLTAAAPSVEKPLAEEPSGGDDNESLTAATTTAAEGIGLPSGDLLESVTRHVMCCSPAPPNSSNAGVPSANRAAEEYARAEARRPVWYNRSSGWLGTTYREGLEFCASQKQGTGQHGEGTNMELCPYEVYCPTGEHHIPLGGFRVEEGVSSSRSPIGDHPDGWVQVGNQNACVQYTIFDDEEDDGDGAAENAENGGSGGTGEQQEGLVEETYVPVKPGPSAVTEELVAKSKDHEQQGAAAVAAPEASPQQQELGSGPSMPSGAANIDLHLPQDLASPLSASSSAAAAAHQQQEPDSKEQERPVAVTVTVEASHLPQDPASPLSASTSAADAASNADAVDAATTDADAALSATATSAHTQQQQMTIDLHQKFKPLWLSASEGWNGGSHSDAVAFCAAIRGKKLCPYAAMCPKGPGGTVMGGRHRLEFEVEGEQYAPVMGGQNHWVMIGNGDGDGASRCKTHRQLEGKAPEWGLTKEKPEVKRHVMCCTVH